MIFKSFLLGNLVSLCMKIINSVVVVGLYYGFLATFSIGPSYLLLLRAQAMEEEEEGTEKQVSTITGFIMGQLMMFISIYYAPLHLALGRPHTITVLALPYLLFQFFWNNNDYFSDFEFITIKSMRNFSIQCIFLNNLIFQLFNNFILPSSMLARLVNIYMFRCNNKILFVTSSFVGWLIGHILFLKWLGLVLVWIRQNHSIRIRPNVFIRSKSNVFIRSKSNLFTRSKLIRSNKYLVAEFLNSTARIFSILLFITCVYYLGRVPSPIFSKKIKESLKTQERAESEEERNVEIETTYETEETEEEQEGFTEEDPSPSLFSEEKEDPDKIDETEEIRVNGKEKTKDEFHFHFKETCYKNSPIYEEKSKFSFSKAFITLLFNYNRWNRPLRYIKNKRFKNAVKKEMSQYFFDACQSYGKKRISFTFPPSLSALWKMIQRNTSLSIIEKFSSDELYNRWISTNKQKNNNLNNEFIKRIKYLNNKIEILNNYKKYSFEDQRHIGHVCSSMLEKNIRLYADKTKKEYLPKIYDPLLTGPYRRTIEKEFSPLIVNKTSIKNFLKINKIHTIFLTDTDYHENQIHTIFLTDTDSTDTDYREFEQNINIFTKKPLSTKINYFLIVISEFNRESKSNLNFKKLSLFKFYFKKLSLFFKKKQRKMDLENETKLKLLKFLFNIIIIDLNNKKKKSIEIKEINKKVPRWSYNLITELQHHLGQGEQKLPTDHHIRSRKFKRIVIFTPNQRNPDTPHYLLKEVFVIHYPQQSDFRRNIIKSSMRTQRRKTSIWKPFQLHAFSALFLERIKKWYVFYLKIFSIFISELSGIIGLIFRTRKQVKLKISDSSDSKEEQIQKEEEIQKQEEKDRKNDELIQEVIKETTKKAHHELEDEQLRIEAIWDSYTYGQAIRSFMLLIQSVLRKYIVLPSLIIVKNIVRMLFFQYPEWPEDFRDWKKEEHVICNYNGVQLPAYEFPRNWLTDGLHIKILCPFYLKPWRRFKRKSSHINRMNHINRKKRKGQKQKNDFSFLTVFGAETDVLFGPMRKRPSLFKPIFKNLKKKIGKLKKKKTYLLVLKVLKEQTKLFLNILKKTKKWIIEVSPVLKEIKEEFSKVNPSKTQKEKDSITRNQIIDKSFSRTQSTDRTNYLLTKKNITDLLTKKNITDLDERTNAVRNELEKIPKSIKTSYNAKRFESPKDISQILERGGKRLSLKFRAFLFIFPKRIYKDILLSIINIPRITIQFFLKSTKEITDKSIYNNKTNQEIINKKNQNTIHFISTINKSLYNISNKNSQNFCDLSFLSQAYVFYKLSQNEVFFSKLKFLFKYYGTSFFLKTSIKDYFEAQGIIQNELRHKKLRNSGMIQWTNWLRGQYQYELSQSRWSIFIAQKWRNRINQCRTIQNPNLNKKDSCEEDQLIHYKKQNDYKVYSLPNQKDNFKKDYRYNLLSYKSINFENKRGPYFYESPFRVTKNKDYNVTKNNDYNTHKRQFFDILRDIPINNIKTFLGKSDLRYTRNLNDRRLLHFHSFNFWRVNVKIENKENYNTHKRQFFDRLVDTSINNNFLGESDFTDTEFFQDSRVFQYITIMKLCCKKSLETCAQITIINKYNKNITKKNKKGNKNTKNWIPYYQAIHKIDKKSFFYVMIDQDQEINSPNQKKKIFDWMGMNERIFSQPISDLELYFFPDLKVLYNTYKKKPWFIPNQLLFFNINENFIENKNFNRKQEGVIPWIDLRSSGQNQGNLVMNNDIYFFMKRHFFFQLKWDEELREGMIHHMQIYCLLLRLTDPLRMAKFFFGRKEMNMEIILPKRRLHLSKFVKRGILGLEPLPISVKNENDGQFIMYQIIGISLPHKSKHHTNKISRNTKFFFTIPLPMYTSKAFLYKLLYKYWLRPTKTVIDLFVPENILLSRRCRELRILICFNSKTRYGVDKSTIFCTGNGIKNQERFLDENNENWGRFISKNDKNDEIWGRFISKNDKNDENWSRFIPKTNQKNESYEKDQDSLMKLKLFLWPNYRLEDLACMNRYWFDNNNGSRFNMLRLHMYPRLKIR
uniref:Protein TIC 214 n=2 Tax=Huodendron TaxID=153520 RepID=A0A7S7BHR5_9ERIC|nr:hypothetical chloroplast RF1 [Huodendron biaristatum]YP_010034056.1 hypothetical chloroplast RF19 [Huodendron tibeticum]QAV58570.1 hypothetical chloroplast RF1 [Huodendron biaristatum]QOW83431.1 hypothetical chloroplast RF19 [Huodendron tibeticum]